MANLLTIIRVVLVFLTMVVWARKIHVDWWWLDALMVVLLAWAIFMDALDGWVARRRGEETESGALFDIAGDRIVELILWMFFAIRQDAQGNPFVAYWIPPVVIVRTVLTDFIRNVAFQHGRTPFGAKSMMASPWAKQIVSSRWSRALYGALKAVTFCALGAMIALQRMPWGPSVAMARPIVDVLVYATVFSCVARAIPVLWDGRGYVLRARDDAAS